MNKKLLFKVVKWIQDDYKDKGDKSNFTPAEISSILKVEDPYVILGIFGLLEKDGYIRLKNTGGNFSPVDKFYAPMNLIFAYEIPTKKHIRVIDF